MGIQPDLILFSLTAVCITIRYTGLFSLLPLASCLLPLAPCPFTAPYSLLGLCT
ncbi:hypothetical protein [Moorena sp. SIO3I6]|uniref:hypothetical protein n=1 Tax=Moorena sp. SIO3I6 TaxID=2607831 RepID=UPI0013FA7D05|nr:hypothetical protein [Moorena sp. SIO3I6]NEP27263.1 hypothetical protein [Moorena sp. SIO3I6]